MLRSECVLNWLLSLIFGWTELKFTVTPTFTKSFSFLNRVDILIFLKEISNNLELLSFQKMYGLRGYLLTAKALAPINGRRVLEGGWYLNANRPFRNRAPSIPKSNCFIEVWLFLLQRMMNKSSCYFKARMRAKFSKKFRLVVHEGFCSNGTWPWWKCEYLAFFPFLPPSPRGQNWINQGNLRLIKLKKYCKN